MADDRYARSVAKIIAGQILESENIYSVQMSTVDILADVLLRRIQEIGRKSHVYAEIAHRSEANPLDVKTALQETGISLKDLESYAKDIEEDSFAQNIAPFPVSKPAPPIETFDKLNEPGLPHIPRFLPVFPDPHSRLDTPQFPPTNQKPMVRQSKLAEQQKEGEEVLLRLKAREEPESELLQAATKPKDAALTAEPQQQNPFLAAPVIEDDGTQWARTLPQQHPNTTGNEETGTLRLLENIQPQSAAQRKAMQRKIGALGDITSLATSGKPHEDAYSKDWVGGHDSRAKEILSTQVIEEGIDHGGVVGMEIEHDEEDI